MTLNKQLPNSTEAEQALLSSMLVYPSAVNIVVEQGLRPDEFFVEGHKRLFTVMLQMQEEGKPIDSVSLIAKCTDLKVLSMVGGADFIMELSDTSVSSANTKYYIELIQNKAYIRNLIIAAQKIAQDGFDSTQDIDDIMDTAEKELLNVTRTRRTSEFRAAKEVVSTVLENIQKMSAQHSSITGIASGYRFLDGMTNGFQNGDLILLAARPSVGKTAFALNMAMNASQISKKAIALFSLEMPAEQLITRMLSVKSKISGNLLRTGHFTNNQQWNALNEAAADLKLTQIFIDDSPTIRVSEIFSKCRKLQTEHPLGMIIIDYIQLISGSGRNSENRQQEVSDISRSLKALARELEVPVIALSQLSRLVEQRAGKPVLSDLRESGSLEQDADIVLFLYRESKKEEEEKETVTTEVIIAKHRNGPTGNIKLAFEKKINAFYNIAEGDISQGD